MTESYAIRAWIGWRARRLTGDMSGWTTFVSDLDKTFLPATWVMMKRHGLLGYLPSVLPPGKPDRLPDETALLLYNKEDSYEGHRATVGGRGYASMHRALFEFDDAARRSRSGWARAMPPAGKMPAHHRSAAPGGLRIGDEAAHIAFVLLDGPSDGTKAAASAVFTAIAQNENEAVTVCEPGLTVVWLAGSPGTTGQAVAEALRAALGWPAQSVVAAHSARNATLPMDDLFAEHPSAEHPALGLQADQSLRFLR